MGTASVEGAGEEEKEMDEWMEGAREGAREGGMEAGSGERHQTVTDRERARARAWEPT